MVSKSTTALAVGIIAAVVFYQWRSRQAQSSPQTVAPPTVDSAALTAVLVFGLTWGVLTYMEDDRQAALNAIEVGDPGF